MSLSPGLHDQLMSLSSVDDCYDLWSSWVEAVAWCAGHPFGKDVQPWATNVADVLMYTDVYGEVHVTKKGCFLYFWGGPFFLGLTKGWFSKKVVLADVPPERKPERGYIRMFPRNENRNEGAFACSPRTKTGTRVSSPKPPFYETTLFLPVIFGSKIINLSLLELNSHVFLRLGCRHIEVKISASLRRFGFWVSSFLRFSRISGYCFARCVCCCRNQCFRARVWLVKRRQESHLNFLLELALRVYPF